MADIGCHPTRTTLRITSTTGDHGTIEGASEQAAGCMTAEQVRRLNKLWSMVETGTSSPLIIQSEAADTSHLVSKDELRQVLTQIPRVDTAEFTRRLAALEQAKPLSLPAPGSSIDVDRIVQTVVQVMEDAHAEERRTLEARIAALERILMEAAA